MNKVSILLPVYNKSDYIEATLDSINSQETRDLFNLEVIIIDDLSTDDSFSKINNYKFDSSLEVRIIRNEVNSGPAFSFNKALEHSTGEFILPFDADDLLPRLGIFYRIKYLIEDNNLDWVSGNELVIGENGNLRSGNEFVKRYSDENNPVTDILALKYFIPAQSLMLRRRVFEKVKWYSEMRSSQDLALSLTLLLEDFRYLFIDEYVAFYRKPNKKVGNSLMLKSTMSGQKTKDLQFLKERLSDRLNDEQIN